MADRRTARGSRLLDPMWHWLAGARDRIYRELEPGALPAAMSVEVAQGADHVVYLITAERPGLVQRFTVGADGELVDITPPDTVEEATGG